MIEHTERYEVPDDAWIPPVAKRALNLLSDQCNELEGANHVLATAIRDIEQTAENFADYDTDGLNRIIHICHTGGVKAALEAS